MTKKKRRGAPVGNLNASRSVVPALKRIAQGKPLPPKLARIAALAEIEASEYADDLGGIENLSAGEKLTIGQWKSARQAELLIWGEALEKGGIQVDQKTGAWDLQGGLQRLGVFLLAQHRALTTYDQRGEKRELGAARRSFEKRS